MNLRDKKLLGLRGEEDWGWMQRVRAVGAQGAAGWGRICYGEDCTWAFTDC